MGFDDSHRTQIHESAHNLVNLVFSGRCAEQVWRRDGSGSCGHAYLSKDISDDDAALALFEACKACAGWVGEEVVYGERVQELHRRNAEDAKQFWLAYSTLQDYLHVSIGPAESLKEVVRYLLTKHYRGWTSVPALMYPNLPLLGEKVARTMVGYDPTLQIYQRDPLLAGPVVTKWMTLRRDVGMAYAARTLGLGTPLYR